MERISLPGGGYAFIPSPSELSANERYNLLDRAYNTLQDFQTAKIAALNETCHNRIITGFTSSASGTEHFYGFQDYDQTNMTQQLLMVNTGLAQSVFSWKIKDNGTSGQTVTLTQQQFLQLVQDADNWKWGNINHYWELANGVLAATTIDEVNAINW